MVNSALASSGSAAVGQIINTTNSSLRKRLDLKIERERRDAKDKAAEEVDAAVRAQPLPQSPEKLKSPRNCSMLMIIITEGRYL